MDIRVLQYFLTIAREGSITGAADSLNMTQPPLSRQLKDLEDELGKKLIIRGNRRIILTEEGMILRKRAEEIVELMEKAKAEIILSDENISGDIYVGAAESEGMRLIAKTIKNMQKDYPNIRFHFYSGNAENLTERLEKGLFDFGVFIEPADMSKYDFIKLPTTDIWGILMRKDCPLASKDNINPDDLFDLPIIISNQAMVRNEISGWMGGEYEKLNIVATYNLLYNASLLVEEKVGYALCLDKIINTRGESTLCFRHLEPKLEVGIIIAWKKYQVFSKAADIFFKRLQKDFASN